MLERTFEQSQDGKIYIDYDDHGAHAHAWWFAASNHLPLSRVVILPDGGIPPPGSMVFGRLQPCDYVCRKISTVDQDYWIARAIGPKPAG